MMVTDQPHAVNWGGGGGMHVIAVEIQVSLLLPYTLTVGVVGKEHVANYAATTSWGIRSYFKQRAVKSLNFVPTV